MKPAQLNDETSILPANQQNRKEPPSQTASKMMFASEEDSKELRKREAEKPLYLNRYE